MRTSLLLAVLLGTMNLWAATYYVSNSGNDSNSGTSAGQAWQTLARLNQSAYSFQPGDQILFERGGVFRGEVILGSSGTSVSPITFGAYGSGDHPVVSGSMVVNNWTVHQGNIWKTNLAQAPKFIFANGQLMQIARFPNTGWLRNDFGTGTMIQDSDLSQSAGYWNGATVVVRSSNWSYDAMEITNHSSGQINFGQIYFDLEDAHWGYFLRNKLSELDAPGEWFYDTATGDLYLQAPGNGNPNNMLVEAAVEPRGAHVHLNRQHLVVDGIEFKHQTLASIKVANAHHIAVQNCLFSDTERAIESYGHHNTYDGNSVERTYKTAIHLLDDNTSVLDNELNDIAMEPGLGENNWGYFGIQSSGDNNTISGNRLHTIGYIGISISGAGLVEHNFVDNALALLNDGCGIGFDDCDGIIVRDNIIVNVQGNLDSSPPNSPVYHPYAYGLYYGNLSVKNTLVENNTVANCRGGGVHVDHTMLSEGNIIRNNTFYNNTMQMSISDWSNYNGPGAQSPFYVADYGTEYTGNILYSTRADQLCMRHLQVWTGAWSDWGNFSNNYYCNPYEKQTIQVFDVFNSNFSRYTVKRWQSDLGEDPGTQPSDKNWPTHEVVNQLGGELLSNGDFDNGIGSWTGWPAEGQLTHDYTYLSNGALKVNFTSSATYHQLFITHGQEIALQNGQWYKLEFSVQSPQHGEVHVGFQANSQFGSPDLVYSKYAAFGPNQRDYVLFFQSDRDEPGKIRFTNIYDEPLYWIDDISFTKVDVVPADPMDDHLFFYNDQYNTQTFNFSGCWSEVNGNTHTNSIDVAPFRSVILVKEDPVICSLSTGVEELTAHSNDWSVFPNPVRKGELLNIGSDHGPGQFLVLDLQGKVVGNEEVVKGQQHVRLANTLATGVYIAKLTSITGDVRLARISVN